MYMRVCVCDLHHTRSTLEHNGAGDFRREILAPKFKTRGRPHCRSWQRENLRRRKVVVTMQQDPWAACQKFSKVSALVYLLNKTHYLEYFS